MSQARPAPASTWILAVVCAAIFFGVLNASAVSVVLPVMGEHYAVGPGPLAWVMSVFLLTYGVAIPFYGRLADRYGARELFIGGLAAFGLGSLACGLAPTLETLVLARVLQGLGGAAFPGLGMTLVSRAFPPERRGLALGTIAATLGVGSAIGPVVGGVIADLLSWRALFLISALATSVIPLARRVLPRETAQHDAPMDWRGGALLALAIASVLVGLGQGSGRGWGDSVVLGTFALALVVFVALVVHQRRTAQPFIPRALLVHLSFRRVVIMATFTSAAYLGAIVSYPLILTAIHGRGPLQVGLAMSPAALVTGITGVLAGRVVDRHGPRAPTLIGALGVITSLALLSRFAVSDVRALIVLAALVGASYSLLNTPMSAALSRLVPDELLAAAMAFYSMVIFVGGSFGTTAVFALFEARPGAPGFGLGFMVLAAPMLLTAALAARLPGREQASAPAIDALSATVLPEPEL